MIVAEIKQLSAKTKKGTTDQHCSESAIEEAEPDNEEIISLESHYEEKSLDPTDLYLREIGAAPLLTKEEEVYFARQLQKGDLSAKNRMLPQLKVAGSTPTPT